MVLYRYFKRGPVLPTIRTCGEQANTEALGESSREPTGKKAVTPRGKYNSYTQKGHGWGSMPLRTVRPRRLGTSRSF